MMKKHKLLHLALLALLLLPTSAVAGAAAIGPMPAESVADAVVLERGPFYKIVQTSSGGQYQEVADGLCYQDPKDGTWKDSRETIEVLDADGTAVARQGQHQVIFS